MTELDLRARVRALFQQVEHADNCRTRFPATSFRLGLESTCTCDREERLIAKVAAAIDTAIRETWGDVPQDAPTIWDAALRAFTEAGQ